MKKWYYIQNEGCDDTTQLLIEMEENEATLHAELFKKMNKNSSYGCQPTIQMREIEFCSKEEFYADTSKLKDFLNLDPHGDYDEKNVRYFKTIKVLVET